MPRSIKIYIGILFLILVGIVLVDANRPKPINWRKSFSLKEKIPFGMYVFNQEKEAVFENQKVIQFSETPYEYFDERFNYIDTTYNVQGTFFYVNGRFDLDEESITELFYFAEHGNTIFLSCENFPISLRDSLNFKIKYSNFIEDSVAVKINRFQKETSILNREANNLYFEEIDSIATVLGSQSNGNNTEDKINFIKVPYGKGAFILHTQPIVFTNYYLLKDNYRYCENVLSYLPKNDIFWKVKRYDGNNLEQSPLRFIFSQPALKYAWLFAMYGLLVFMLFNAKRRQRVIPINIPLKNTTVEFTKTIGNLYYQERDHLNIIDKKIIFFLEKIRNDYYLDTFNLDESFVNKLSQKTGKNKTEVNELISFIKKLRTQTSASEEDIINLNKKIEKFYS